MVPRHEFCIEAEKAESQYWRDLWSYRNLFYFLAWRDILVRYKQTVLGAAWAVLRPLITIAVFSLVFGRLAGLPDGGIPYPLLVFAAMLPWQLFASAVSECSNSLLSNANLVSKVYFPRLLIPAGSVMVCLVDFLVAGAILGLLLGWYGWWPGWRLLALPPLIALALAAAAGAGIWFAALNVRFRDFRHIVPVVVQLGLYLSPVGFRSEVVQEKLPEFFWLYSLNPMVGVIDGFRWALLGDTRGLSLDTIGLSAGIVALILYTGLRYFRAMERTFADEI